MGAAANFEGNNLNAIEPYNMHVSSRYLELTRKKLELTRLPRELLLSKERQWKYGTPKNVLEPLVDFWLEHYEWRRQETHYNVQLPQFRAAVTPMTSLHPPLRLHFVHKRCSLSPDAPGALVIPLLFCHDYPSSFLDVGNILTALTCPVENGGLPGTGAAIGFHVVAPSIPGMGFSDASPEEGFGLRETADLFDALMEKLGYKEYVAYGSGWGFQICRMLALHHSANCKAVHTVNSSVPPPSFMYTPLAYLKYHIARLTHARIPGLRFGYRRLDFCPSSTPSPRATVIQRPQTQSYALCDSPVGLLATILDALQPSFAASAPALPRSAAAPATESGSTTPTPSRPCSAALPAAPLWKPTTLLDWTMMQWLPGPEAGLRWLQHARAERALYKGVCGVPLGISVFGDGDRGRMAGWAGAWWKVGWVGRRDEGVQRVEWEAPELLVLDLREAFAEMVGARS
ncbi:uncharacterized protein K452DRAFT_54976 [Aplosporella prunicola CBS 121167]|uniref:Epoxide hydrolase N-terminal domain-containing protein n=1 Tax=Aplosporella prunicola CBS 121167 TaxID=1176127 RepID=A0A6A6B8U9_9PEZI|nr:uncharacterized protein K452DRAFT_54976 [Aplosporella prunicola CBS 121167]KAF2140376.1 hypothetical protein K452DRAFT_54976 [Aplosporella prunicola CBS 121167]